jgi:replicative DNA helicase
MVAQKQVTDFRTRKPITVNESIPQNAEAEEAVIGSLLIDRDSIIRVSGLLSYRDFFSEERAIIYQAILELFNERIPADIVILKDYLKKHGLLGEDEGQVKASYIFQLIRIVPTSVHVEYYAKIVRVYSFLRKMIQLGADTTAIGFSQEKTPEELLDYLTTSYQKLTNWYQKGLIQDFILTKEKMLDLDCFEDQGKKLLPPLSTGWINVDGGNGWQLPKFVIERPGITTIIAATGVGKTTAAMQIAVHNASFGKVYYYHTELSSQQMKFRLYSSLASVEYKKLRLNRLTDQERIRIAEAAARMSKWIDNLIFIHCPGWSCEKIAQDYRSRFLADKEKGLNPSLLVLDYLQRTDYYTTMKQVGCNEASAISIQLQYIGDLANELDIAVLLLSQMARDSEDKVVEWYQEPRIDKCKGSSAIEQFSCLGLGFNRNEKTNEAKLMILKATFDVNLQVIPMRFVPGEYQFIEDV